MTIININKTTSFSTSIPSIDKIDFNYLGNKVYSATKTERIYATFVSNVVEASEYFLKWHEITWNENKTNYSDVQMFIKIADTENELDNATWSGPYFNETATLTGQDGRYLQFCVLLRHDFDAPVTFPNVTDINLKYYTSETAARFYSRTFNVGFTPKSVVLTYNADTNDDAIIRFAISGADTADTSYYQYIEPNKIVTLDSLTYLSDNVKVLMEMVGTSESQVIVHEFALMFSGEDAFRVNKLYMQSSSSTSSSSTSESTSSSSSSTSESSESEGNTSSSTSSSSDSSSSSESEGNTSSSSSSSSSIS